MRKMEERQTAEAKTGRLEQACARYGLGKSSMRKLASDAGAVIHVGKCYLVNFTLVDQYLDRMSDIL